MRTKEQVAGILAALEAEYPMADCTLEERDPWKLLVQVRLAAQCTDERVNKVTPALFEKYPDCFAMAKADISDVEEYIRSCGFYHGKARDLVLQANQLSERFGGKVPDNMEDLLILAGVGRKAPISSWETCTTSPGRWWWTPTASASPTGWAWWTTKRTPQRSKNSSGLSCPRRRATTSATGWCSTAGPCAPPGSRPVKSAAVRPSVKL